MTVQRSQWAKWIGVVFFLLGSASFINSNYWLLTKSPVNAKHIYPLFYWAYAGNIGNIIFGITLFFQRRAVIFWVAYGVFFTVVVSTMSYQQFPNNRVVFGLLVSGVIQFLLLLLVVRLWKSGKLR